MGLIDDVKIGDLVVSRAEFLEHRHVFTSTPDSVDGDVELELACEELRKLGERQTLALEAVLDRRLWRCAGNVILSGVGEERRVLRDVFQCPVGWVSIARLR